MFQRINMELFLPALSGKKCPHRSRECKTGIPQRSRECKKKRGGWSEVAYPALWQCVGVIITIFLNSSNLSNISGSLYHDDHCPIRFKATGQFNGASHTSHRWEWR